MKPNTKIDWIKLFQQINKVPLRLPKGTIVDGIDRSGWTLRIETYAPEGSYSYLKAMYVNPLNDKEYIFNSAYSEELLDYLKEFNLLGKVEK